ncbi:uncharacterized protein ACR2FA_001748 [Aphomia sociella]
MNINYVWIFLLILQCVLVTPRPIHNQHDGDKHISPEYDYNAQNIPKYENTANPQHEQVISVRITSSVAVGRRKGKPVLNNHDTTHEYVFNEPFSTTDSTTLISNTDYVTNIDDLDNIGTDTPPNLIGANIEFIKQLNAKKELKGIHSDVNIHPFQFNAKKETEEYHNYNNPVIKTTSEFEMKKNGYFDSQDKLTDILPTEYHNYNSNKYELENNRSISDDSIAEPSIKSLYEINSEINENKENIPLARSAASSSNQYDNKNIIVRDSYQFQIQKPQHNETDGSIAKPSIKSVLNINNKNFDNNNNIPIARSIPIASPSNNYVQGLSNKPLSERGNGGSLTTVSFNIVHDTSNQDNYNEPKIDNKNYNQGDSQKSYEPPKVYSQPAQIYSEPAKFYSEPAKVYSEPAKIYSEPAKIYSEPAKIYSEPAKFYSQPASLHLPPSVPPNYTPWQHTSQKLGVSSTSNTTPITTITNPSDVINQQTISEHQPEKNYEVDEKISVLSEGRIHGVQETTTEKCKQDNCKVGYVVEGRQYKKYRVEERTSDGFIVGEYGVVRNEDGALRGVRYTADSDASPRLIYDALMKFLQLK